VLVGAAALYPASPASAQAEPVPSVPVAPADPAAPPTVPVESSVAAPPASTTSTTLAKCDATADVTVIFTGNPITRTDSKVTFVVKSVLDGQVPPSNVPAGNVEVDFPRDERFLFDQDTYLVAAGFDVEAKSLVSKVRPLPDTPPHCFAKDLIVTKHADGTPIDTGVFAGMNGNWKRVPLAFVIPLGVVLGALIVLVILRRTSWWLVRRTIGEWISDRRFRRLADQPND
jgi:hypothetical protein